MWMFIIIYFIWLALEGAAEIIRTRKGKNDAWGSLSMTILGFVFIASAVNSDACPVEAIPKIAFVYSILYAVYWIIVQVFRLHYKKR